MAELDLGAGWLVALGRGTEHRGGEGAGAASDRRYPEALARSAG